MDTPNIYDTPEHYGLTIVYAHEFGYDSYERDTRVVWEDVGTGRRYTARGTGDSERYPFAGLGRDDLEEVPPTLIDYRRLDLEAYPHLR